MQSIFKSFEFLFHGGFMMLPLLLSALLALTIIFERLYRFRTHFHTQRGLLAEILHTAKAHKLEAARALCEKTLTPVTAVLQAGLEHFENPAAEMELAMKNRGEEWVPVLEKRIEIIDTVITAAPLMGLLGTITGMMASFQVLSEKGVNEPNAITGGVAEALIATATGLVIALVCLVAYNYLTTRVKTCIYELESAASRLMEIRMNVERRKGA